MTDFFAALCVPPIPLPVKTLQLLSLLCLASALFAQEPVPEGTLNKFLDRESKEVTGQLALMQQEVYQLKTELQVLAFRQEYGDRIALRRVMFPANTADREAIPGYIFTPKTLAAGKKYPGLVMVHGGNHVQLTGEWFPWIVGAIERGYVVLFPEYRGSSGHGETIYKNNYGVTDLADVLAGTAFFAAQPFVDAARLGVFGHSRGGMLCLRTLEVEPQRFKAAVDVAGLSDMVAFMSYKSDARRKQIAADAHYGGKLPGENLAAYVDVSPAFHIEKIETPVLLLSTTGDKTVPYQLHNKRVLEALKAYGKVHDAHLYEQAPGGHEFLFVDSPEGTDSMRRTFEWFAKYLKP